MSHSFAEQDRTSPRRMNFFAVHGVQELCTNSIVHVGKETRINTVLKDSHCPFYQNNLRLS